jgi:SRSO17 transposase
VATSTQHLPIDIQLFLPETWLTPEGRARGKIPDDIEFRTKHDIALAMIRRAMDERVPGRIVLADSFYGHCRPFRDALWLLGLDYGMAIYASDSVRVCSPDGSLGEPMSVKKVAQELSRAAYREYTWKEGSKAALKSRFAFRRVRLEEQKGLPGRTEWLIVEWPENESDPTGYFLTTLPSKMKKARIIRLIKERWRTERVYQDMKGHLGLDHYEGRSYRGWNHHVSVALCCFAFLVAERSRAFPPSARGASRSGSVECAA